MSSGASRAKISTASWSARKSEPLTVSNACVSAESARVPERGVDAALGRAGVAAGRMELRDDGDVGSGVVRRDRARIPAQPARVREDMRA